MIFVKSNILEIFFTKLIFNLKVEAAKTYLSYLWWLLEPALMVMTFYLIFAVFFSNGTDDFIIFLLCGNIPFFWFSKSIGNSTSSIISGASLISQISIPKPFFPLLVIFQDFVKQFAVFVFLLTFFILYGMKPSIVWLSLSVVIITQFVFTIAVSLFVAGVTPYIPDFRFLVDTGLLMLMFASGVFFRYQDVILPAHQKYFLLNPMANLIENYRTVLMNNNLPDWTSLSAICLLSLVFIVCALIYYRRTDTLYARLVIQ